MLKLSSGFPALAFTLSALVASAAVSAETDLTDEAALSPAALRQALLGERFAYKGQLREGDSAKAFAEGYIFALAERAAQEGLSCSYQFIAPHELVAAVYDSIPAPADTETAASSPTAAEQVMTLLQVRFPCQ